MTGAPTHLRSDRERVAVLERRLEILEATVQRQRLALPRWPKRVWLATTTTSGTYPSAPADTFEFIFANGTFTETAGDQTATLTDRQSSAPRVAHSIGGVYYPEDAEIYVAEIDRQYWIIGGEHIARVIDFELDEALATTDANKTASVDAYYDGGDPGSTVEVYNRAASTNYIFEGDSGDKGIALWDDVRGNYRIVQMECP